VTEPPRILIVDDDPTAIEVLGDALEGLGEVCFASSGVDALDLLTHYPVDLVLLDANMPDLDGFATCQILKQEYPNIPVIFVTAFTADGYELRALKAGAVDFIHKPIKPPVVRARVGVHLQLGALTTELRAMSNRDSLTGIANRRALDERLTLEWRRAARHRQPLALLMTDIDHFKRYNDLYGHLHGDDCLRQVAQTLAATCTRAGDMVARYGGEEFAILLAGSDLKTAVAVATKICNVVRTLAIPHADSDAAPHVTLSLGVASGVPSIPAAVLALAKKGPPLTEGIVELQSTEDLLGRADRALYAAKAAGRNRICLDDSPPNPD
jgi:diguanylate cyclase (GGDEF)-like protein